jgi:hypothetical protein
VGKRNIHKHIIGTHGRGKDKKSSNQLPRN